MREEYTVLLAGNPNVGKSTIFNALTGMRQHTGNWPGKTVELARGWMSYGGARFCLTDLPGTYGLQGSSPEETVAADCIRQERPDCVVVVCDATALERSLNLAVQLLTLESRVLLCLNLTDEAEKQGLATDAPLLSERLGIPVVCTRADRKRTMEDLRKTLLRVCTGDVIPKPVCTEPMTLSARAAFCELLVSQVQRRQPQPKRRFAWDSILLGRYTAYPVLLLLLFAILWLTMEGANLPSRLLETLFAFVGEKLNAALGFLPTTWRSLLTEGIYGTTTQVAAVMLPPMLIFYPLFTILEDLGYLPRAAFLLDRPFACCGTCGKHALTTCMGFGCNAVGVLGCRIIDSPRERLTAILTNSFVPCNGRFPTLIFLLSFLTVRGQGLSGLVSAALLTGLLVLSVGVTLLTSYILSKTLLRGQSSAFVLELPPYRRPQLRRVIIRSVADRTLRVLGRAVKVAAPAGLLIWCLANLRAGDMPLLCRAAQLLEPVGLALGLNGALLLAFLLGFPANELVLPMVVLILTAGSALGAEPGAAQLRALLTEQGMTVKTAVCAMVFCLFHWPCSTTVLTIRRETGSLKWTLLSVLLPTAAGALLCGLLNALFF